jgi:hypothetical protein
VAFPKVVEAASTAAVADHPDRELIDLGREYQRLEQAINAADAVVEAYREQGRSRVTWCGIGSKTMSAGSTCRSDPTRGASLPI